MELVGTSWRVLELSGRAVAERAVPTLVFGADHRVLGSTGLNRFAGPYRVVGDTVEFGDIVSTRTAGPHDLMDQERRLLAVLAAASRLVPDGADVLLEQPGGRTRLVPAPAPDPDESDG